MKTNQRILCCLTALLAVSAAMLACGDDAGQTEVQSTQGTETTVTETEDNSLKSNLPEVDYNGETISILTAAEQWSRYYYVEKEAGDVIDDAVYQRNRTVSEQLNVNFDFQIYNGFGAGKSAVATALRGEVMGGTGAIDLFAASSAYISGLLMENLFYNLNDVEYIDFDQPWWLGDTNKLTTLDGKLYLGAGTLGMAYLDNSRCIYFNKKLAGTLDITGIYEDVKAGKWTIDLFETYGKMAVSDLNGDGAYDGEDRYGYAGTVKEGLDALFFGLGKENTVNDENGIPRLIGATEHMEDIYNRLKPYGNDKMLYYPTKEADPVHELYPMFMSDKALFISYSLKAVSARGLSDMEDFGILPMPKYDEAQEKYRTFAFTDVMGIPQGQTDEEITRDGIIMEALNFENYKTVYPAYKDVALERKYARDEESADMIDIIVDGVYLDFGMLFYEQLDLSTLYMNTLLEKYDSYATFWAKQEKAMTKKLDKIIETMMENGE